MTIDWTTFDAFIAGHNRFLVTSHVRPDGDALGSELAMAGLLEQRGKDVRVVNVSPLPPRYDFLIPKPGFYQRFDQVISPVELADREAMVILDLSSWSQLGDMAGYVRDFNGPKLVIDHHVSQDDMGATVLKDVTAESTGTLVLRASRALKIPLTETMATGLLTAIAMDTGWFRHPNVRPETLRDAAELVEAGAAIHRVYRQLYERNSPSRIRMVGRILSGLRFESDGRVAVGAVTREDFRQTGAIPSDTEDLIDQIASVDGVEVAMLFIEQPRGGVKLSMRSRSDLDVAELAGRFGGGGHRAAAGAMLPEPLDEAREEALDAVRAVIEAG